MAMVSQ
jgi:hypothetical protein